MSFTTAQYLTMRDGQSVFVRTLGRGRPVMVLHGFGMESRHWIPLLLPLAGKYQFILPDFRGFGASGRTPLNDEDVFRNFYSDIEDLLDHLGLDKIPFAGISMGAYTTLYYLTHEPQHRVEKFCCIDQSPYVRDYFEHPYGLGGKDHEAWMSRIEDLLRENEKHPGIQCHTDLPQPLRDEFIAVLGDFFSASFPFPLAKQAVRQGVKLDWVQKILIPAGSYPTWIAIVRAYLENENYNLIQKVQQIRIPVTIMAGMRNDMYPPAGSEFLHAAIPGSRFVRFHHSGHSLIYTEPVKFIRWLKRFLEE